MRSAAALVFLFFSGPAWSQAPRARESFDLSLMASVVSAALAFISPRALDAVSVQQLALWGLAAPASLDTTLSTELRDGSVVLLQNGRVIFTRQAPADEAAGPWGLLVADVMNAAVLASASVRLAGTQGVITGFFDELLSHLDPYSRYIPPEAATVDRARRSGEAGAGIQVDRVNGVFIVTSVNASGPGADAGIRVGDRIVAIDGQTVAGETLDVVLDLIGGLEGTMLTITVRSRNGPVRALDVERAVTPPETVFATRLNELLVIRISGFSSDTDQRLQRELERNLAGAPGRAIRGIVLDLRGNRGGLLRQAVAATNLVMNGGLVATTAGRNPQAVHEWRAGTGDISEGRPMIVLVDGRSASAAEIMAAALADQGRAVVVGSTTLGKGLVQTIATLPDGGELFVSWSRVLAPDGWPIQGLGVLPQVCTSLGEDAATEQLRALDRGIQPMAGPIARHRAARAPLPAPAVLALRNACPASESHDTDLSAARFLVTHAKAYTTARLRPSP